MTTPAQLLADQCARDGSRPFLTYYDVAGGERIELSLATTANWVAKTANFLTDEYDVDPGDLVGVLLPLHWQTAVVVLACWSTGARVSFDEAGSLTFATADTRVGGDTVVLDLAPMGGDFSRLVASQPDDFVPNAASGEEVVGTAAGDLPAAARVLTVLAYDRPGALSYGLVAPLAVGGSVVLAAHATTADLVATAGTERVTHTLGTTVAGLARLDT